MHSVLKEKIVEIYGAPVSAARDCEALAKNISIRTTRSISSTTVRRFFGLLKSSSSISRYNLDTLAIYCGARDYSAFCNAVHAAMSQHPVFDIDLPEKLDQITKFTLASMARKTLGGFERTIPRAELNRKLDEFLESDYSIFPVIAPGGYGKSTALAHWVTGRQGVQPCLFCGAGLMLSMLEERSSMKETIRLGLNDKRNIYNRLLPGTGEGSSALVLVVDALEEISNNTGRMFKLIDYLFDAASMYAGSRKVKFVFSIRESIWHNYLRVHLDRVEAGRWFETAGPLPDTGYANLPQLSNSEIRAILSNFRGEEDRSPIFECIPWDIREQLRIPIQLYCISRLLRDTPSPEHLSKTDVVRVYLEEFLFRAKYAEEKEDIIWHILGIMEEPGDRLAVVKSELKKKYPVHLKRETAYYHAYRDLLSDGILLEEREENAYGIYVTRVGFRHLNFFVYLYALYLIRENGGLSFSLFSGMASLKPDQTWINDIVAILYQIAYESASLEVLKDFCTLPERILSSLSVRLVVGASFRKDPGIRQELVSRYAASETGRRCFFEYFVDTNYLFNNYLARIREYQQHAAGTEAALFSNAILYLGSFLKMDAAGCRKYAGIMEDIEPGVDVHPWPTGRKVFTHLLQDSYVKGNEGTDFSEYVLRHTRIAYGHPGYLQKGLVEFEMYIMVAMVLIRDFTGLYRLLDRVDLNYNMENTEHGGAAVLRRNQNSIPRFFLEYAIFKLNYTSAGRPDLMWAAAIDNYTTNYDDFQYLILLHWFLVDYYTEGDEVESAILHYDAALDLARFAGYDFYEAFLLVNDPLKDPDRVARGGAMIAASGFSREKFNYPFGPCA